MKQLKTEVLTPAQKIDLEERIAIRVEDRGQDEEEATEKAKTERINNP